MNQNDEFHVYAGFVLGLHVANSILRAEIGYRYDDLIEALGECSQGNSLNVPSADALLRRFPLAQGDELRPIEGHPVLVRAATYVLDWHNQNGTKPE